MSGVKVGLTVRRSERCRFVSPRTAEVTGRWTVGHDGFIPQDAEDRSDEAEHFVGPTQPV